MYVLPTQRLRRITLPTLIIASIILAGAVFCAEMKLHVALITFWALGTGLTLPVLISEHKTRRYRYRTIRAALVEPHDIAFTSDQHNPTIAEARIDYQETLDGAIHTTVTYDAWFLDLGSFSVKELARKMIQREKQSQDARRIKYTMNSKLLVRLYTEAQLVYIITGTIIVYIVDAFTTAGQPYAAWEYWAPLFFAVLLGAASLIGLPWWMISAIQRRNTAMETLYDVLTVPEYTQTIPNRYKPHRRIPLRDIYEVDILPPKAARIIFDHAFRIRQLGVPDHRVEEHMAGMMNATREAIGERELPDDPAQHQRVITAEYFQKVPLYPQ